MRKRHYIAGGSALLFILSALSYFMGSSEYKGPIVDLKLVEKLFGFPVESLVVEDISPMESKFLS